MSCRNEPSNPNSGAGADTPCDETMQTCSRCDATVTIGRVRRGNPYAPRNITTGGMPDSVPPSKTYEVEVTVTWSKPSCPGQYIELSIINGSADNGTATVSPTRITATATVTVTGVNQTRPGHAGQLKVQAKLDGATVKAESAGFTVCAHPINYSDPFHHDINAGGVVGIAVQDGWDSDSGTFADLSETEIKELVDEPPPTVPPFHNDVFGHSNYLPGDQLTVDSHTISKPSRGPAADWIMPQLVIYKCKRCGCTDIDQPNSGMNIIHHVFRHGGVWKHRAEKVGAAVTIGAHTTQAGNANAQGPHHAL